MAQELACWAVEQEGGEVIHDLLFRAYFVDKLNVGDTSVLLDLAANAGLDRDAASQVLEQRTCKAQVDADWDKSRQYGVTGVPTYVAAGSGVVGAQSYEVLEQLVRDAGATSAASS